MEPVKKLDLNKSINKEKADLKALESQEDHQEVKETLKSINQGLNVLNENADLIVGGDVSEKVKSGSENAASGAGVGRKTTKTLVQALPTIEEMIKQTEEAIILQIKIKTDEVKKLASKKSTKPYELNNAAREIRVLNGLLYQLKHAAKVAADFIVNLWKQYVKRVG